MTGNEKFPPGYEPYDPFEGQRDNLISPMLNANEVAVGANPNVLNTIQKNLSNMGNAFTSSIGDTLGNIQSMFSSSGTDDIMSGLTPNISGAELMNNSAYKVPGQTEVLGGVQSAEAAQGFNFGKAGDFMKSNAGNILGAVDSVGGAFKAMSANKELGENIKNMEKSISDLTDVSQTISADYGEDARKINTDLSEGMQASAQNLLSQVQIPKELNTNLSVGASSQTAQDMDRKIKTRLTTLFDSQKSKAKDIADQLNISASTATSKISSATSAMEEEIDKMEQAQKNNKLNAALDLVATGASFFDPTGGIASRTIANQFKKSNEYS